jgi:hypothetical protein
MADVPDSKSGSSANSFIADLGLASVQSRGIPEPQKGESGPGNGRVRPFMSMAADVAVSTMSNVLGRKDHITDCYIAPGPRFGLGPERSGPCSAQSRCP